MKDLKSDHFFSCGRSTMNDSENQDMPLWMVLVAVGLIVLCLVLGFTG